MQKELDAAGLAIPVQILGVNQDGHQVPDYDAGICADRDIPLLEEGPGDAVWAAWRVRYRDVVILDGDNEVVGVFNLTDHDLRDPASYAQLRDLLLEQAGAP